MIAIKPTPTRPVREPFEKLLVNPEIIETFGRKIGSWESCLIAAATTRHCSAASRAIKKCA